MPRVPCYTPQNAREKPAGEPSHGEGPSPCDNRKLLRQPLCSSPAGGNTSWYSHRARRMMLIMCSRSSTTAPPSSISSGQVPATLLRIARPSRHHGLHAESLRLLLSLPSRLKLQPDGRMATVAFRHACWIVDSGRREGRQSIVFASCIPAVLSSKDLRVLVCHPYP